MRRLPGVLLALVVASASLAACKADDARPGTNSSADAAPRAFSGRARLTGSVTSFSASAAAIEDIAAPFTINVPEAGRGGLTMPNALVGGKEVSIVWTGGRPLPVTGRCTLLPGEVAVLVEGTAATLSLDGAPRAITGAACTLGSSVAVGRAGFAKPVPSVTFTAPGEAGFSTSGGATLSVPAARRYEGRSGGLRLDGDFSVESEKGPTTRASRVEMTTGIWVVELTEGTAAGTLRVVATVEGALTIGPASRAPADQ